MNPTQNKPAGFDRVRFWLRAIVFVPLAGFMLFGPFYTQILGNASPYLREWIMFSGLGVGFDEVRFSRLGADGKAEPLDRFELMGYRQRHKAPTWLTRIPDYDTSLRIGHLLCHRLGDGADVRIESRRATIRGWTPGHRGDRNVCLTKPAGRPVDPNPALHRNKSRRR